MADAIYAVLGASGHIGSAVVSELRAATVPFVALTHDQQSADELVASGVQALAVDVDDTTSLQSIFRQSRRAFLLNPPADVTTDTDTKERATAKSIADAVDGSGLEKVVLVSAYGAQPGERIGDLSVLYEFERMVEQTGIPTAINRGAYYFTNLDSLFDAARSGTIKSAFPEDMPIPMVSPIDLGKRAAARLLSPTADVGIQYVEGPTPYNFLDVATAFSDALGHAVLLEKIPGDQIEASYREMGFSDFAAEAYARMTKVSIAGVEMPEDPVRGSVTLADHVCNLVEAA